MTAYVDIATGTKEMQLPKAIRILETTLSKDGRRSYSEHFYTPEDPDWEIQLQCWAFWQGFAPKSEMGE